MQLDLNKVLSYIGLAQRSRNVISGEFMTEKFVKNQRAELVIVAEDASENTKKKFENMCEFYKVPICFLSNKEDLGHAMGKQMRASLAITDHGLANAIKKQL